MPMETMLRLMLKYAITILTMLCITSCKEPCLDVALINAKTQEMQSWYTDSSITTKSTESSVGISDQVTLEHEFYGFGDTIWDDCGNVTQAERSTVRYDFFNFPFSIETVFNKQGEENGFSFTVNYNMYSAGYFFMSQSTTTPNTIAYISDYELNDIIYEDAFEVTFNQTQSDTEIKELIFVKGIGIIYILLNDGITIEMN